MIQNATLETIADYQDALQNGTNDAKNATVSGADLLNTGLQGLADIPTTPAEAAATGITEALGAANK